MPTMPKLNRFGDARVPVMQVDAAGPPLAQVVALARRLAPFPAAMNNYPGLRRVLSESDGPAFEYVVALLQEATPYIAGAFDIAAFELVEASFSLVTALPSQLAAVQRAPHFDDVDPDLYAVLHYAAPCAGTAFFRHRASGTEVVTAANVDAYVAAARCTPVALGYVGFDDPAFACTGHVEGVAGRLIAYPARALHSGLIPHGFIPSADPAAGRLTANLFIRTRR
ncbi:MAG: hypothetical protein KGL48_07200 [Sphingomonadales bacterium]|nr:hypothetical protein [Sphingomonadales bacterium]MDE2569193.1 hypothetical protein [Sphingomonadales bacterium]